MSDNSKIKITVQFNDPNLDVEDRDEEARNLIAQVADMDGVIVQRIVDPNPPKEGKGIGGFLAGFLTIEFYTKNAKSVFQFLGDRLLNKVIELEVEGNGKKLKVRASSQTELKIAVQQAQEFIGS